MKTLFSSQSVFFSKDEVKPGFVAVEDDKIVAVGSIDELASWQSWADVHIAAGKKSLTPGLVDVHSFFTGWAHLQCGQDLSGLMTAAEILEQLKTAEPWGDEELILAKNIEAGSAELAALQEALLDFEQPVFISTPDRSFYLYNQKAQALFELPDEVGTSEELHKLYAYLLKEPRFQALYKDYQHFLHSRGVTATKEMSFDDYSGFADQLHALDEKGELKLRVSLQSQPVAAPMNLEHGNYCRNLFAGSSRLNFSGFNRMCDRSIGSGGALLKEAYASDPNNFGRAEEDFDLIANEVLAADAAGFRFSLHAQGDAAIAQVVDIYERCTKDEAGKLKNRHAITDLEFSDVDDLKRFGALGGFCEVYAQIQQLDYKDDLVDMVERQLGLERYKRYWQRRQMIDAGCHLCVGTDLPLLYPHLGEALASAAGGRFADGKTDRLENMISREELVSAFTEEGALDAYFEGVCGRIAADMAADLVIWDRDIFAAPANELTEISADSVYSDGQIVYRANEKGQA